MMRRRDLAPTSTFTDAAGNNEKARALSAGEQQGQRAVVNLEFKPTGGRVGALPPVFTPTQSGLSDAPKLASSLSRRSPVKARYGADDEHSAFR